jgi:transposase
MRKDTLVFIGLDTHKEFIEVAYSENERTASAQHYGKIKTTKPALAKIASQFVSKYPNATLHFVSEAGPCGY